jgi:hypothetical protein
MRRPSNAWSKNSLAVLCAENEVNMRAGNGLRHGLERAVGAGKWMLTLLFFSVEIRYGLSLTFDVKRSLTGRPYGLRGFGWFGIGSINRAPLNGAGEEKDVSPQTPKTQTQKSYELKH